jgi:hypothetical protein
VPFLLEEEWIDFEGEFAVIIDRVPMGASIEQAASHIKLIAQVNHWSLRWLAPLEMKTGFGWIQAKPACSMAPVVVTPDELGEAWRDGQVALTLRVERSGEWFGHPSGFAMGFAFPELIAHAAGTRELCAGTIVGSARFRTRTTAKSAPPASPSVAASKWLTIRSRERRSCSSASGCEWKRSPAMAPRSLVRLINPYGRLRSPREGNSPRPFLAPRACSEPVRP